MSKITWEEAVLWLLTRTTGTARANKSLLL